MTCPYVLKAREIAADGYLKAGNPAMATACTSGNYDDASPVGISVNSVSAALRECNWQPPAPPAPPVDPDVLACRELIAKQYEARGKRYGVDLVSGGAWDDYSDMTATLAVYRAGKAAAK